jgi:hypothetical protein
MPYKFIVSAAILFPMVGVWLMENGAFGESINKQGYPNGATLAFGLYAGVAFATIWAASDLRIFHSVGCRPTMKLTNPSTINGRVFLLMMSMALFLVFGLSGIDNYLGIKDAGTFRASLSGASGAAGGIILKYLAPALFAFALMTNAAWDKRQVLSPVVIALAILMLLIGGSYGFKSSFILAMLPATILYFWRNSPLTLIPLGAVAVCVIIFGYFLFGRTPDVAVAFGKMTDRLFVLQGDVSWLIWERHQNGEPQPDYVKTLLPIAGDRIFSMITGIDRNQDELQWVMSHFGLMITYLSGYSVEAIYGGHSNTGTVFSEGVLAGGLFGLVLFGVLVGVVVNMLYNFINNRLIANDFAAAAVAAAYSVNALMAWLLSGGLQAAFHISIPLIWVVTVKLLRLMGRTARSRPSLVPVWIKDRS